MALDLHDCQFHGPALPEPFVKFELEKELTKRKLLVKTTGDEGRALQAQWDSCAASSRALPPAVARCGCSTMSSSP